MKYILLLVLSTYSVVQVHSKLPFFGDLSPYKDECAREVGIDVESVTHSPNSGGGGQPTEPSHELKCFFNCMTRKAGVVDSNGVLQTSKVNLPSDVTNIDLDKCANIRDSDPCQQIYLIEICIREQLPKHQYKNLCAQELDIDVSDWKSEPAPTGDGTTPYLEEPDRDGKCLINCMMLKAGIIDDNGSIQSRFILLPDPDKCSYEDELDACQRAYLIEKCIRRELHLPIRKKVEFVRIVLIELHLSKLSNGGAFILEAAAAVEWEKFIVGYQLGYDVLAASSTKNNLALEYTIDDITLSGRLENQNVFGVGIGAKVNNDLDVACDVSWNYQYSDVAGAIGAKYELHDLKGTIKAKINSDIGFGYSDVAGAIGAKYELHDLKGTIKAKINSDIGFGLSYSQMLHENITVTACALVDCKNIVGDDAKHKIGVAIEIQL
ncbi:Eukaryotic porin [Popillia japonica]|uniref:Eukaryotic porin n=1 Tax=Popillia japonica TaxID=7064 RepID=A0AAW1KKW8_POPJA